MANKTQWLTSTDYFEGLLYDGADARALILDMLSNRSPCSKLARNVTSFFGEDLRLSTYPDAAYSSVYTYTVDDKVHIRLGLASDRVMESLVHELLHLELLREGFPRLDIHDTPQNRDAFHSHYGLFNYLQHEVMYPMYVSLGLGSSRFLAEVPSKGV